jgi:hypothetical protein
MMQVGKRHHDGPERCLLELVPKSKSNRRQLKSIDEGAFENLLKCARI